MKHAAYYAVLTTAVLSWITFPAYATENIQGGGGY